MEEQHLTERESLHLIEAMILKAKNNFSESGTLYLVWGVVIFICGMVQFIAMHFFNVAQTQYVWFFTWMVLIYQVFFLSKKRKKRRVKNYTDDILKYTWLCFTICMAVLIFILVQHKAFNAITPAILVLYAVPTFISGATLQVRSLMGGAIFCWVFALAASFVPYEFQMLFISAAVLVGWIIPGVQMRKRYLKENS